MDQSKEESKTKKLYLMIETETYNRIVKIAKEEDRSMSRTAMRLIRMGLEQYGKHGS